MSEAETTTRRSFGEMLRRNPISLKELRGRMRGARAFVVLTVYVILMSGFASLLYLTYTASSGLVASGSGAIIGKIIFGGVLGVQMFLVCFVAPSFTAGAISGERERQTLDLLRTTLLPARKLVLGKLGSALSYVVLLLVAAIPLQSLAFLMGGIVIEEVLLSVVILLVTAITFSAMGLYFSATAKRTLVASVLTYSFALASTIGLPLLAVILGPVFGLLFNDFDSSLVESVAYLVGGFLLTTNPILTTIFTEVVLQDQGTIGTFQVNLSSSSNSLTLVSPWVVFVVVYLLATIVLIANTVRVVKKAED